MILENVSCIFHLGCEWWMGSLGNAKPHEIRGSLNSQGMMIWCQGAAGPGLSRKIQGALGENLVTLNYTTLPCMHLKGNRKRAVVLEVFRPYGPTALVAWVRSPRDIPRPLLFPHSLHWPPHPLSRGPHHFLPVKDRHTRQGLSHVHSSHETTAWPSPSDPCHLPGSLKVTPCLFKLSFLLLLLF